MATKAETVTPNILGPQYVTCFMSNFWSLEFRGGSWVFKKLVYF